MRIREVSPEVTFVVQFNLAIWAAMLGCKMRVPTALAVVDHLVANTAPSALLHFRETCRLRACCTVLLQKASRALVRRLERSFDFPPANQTPAEKAAPSPRC